MRKVIILILIICFNFIHAEYTDSKLIVNKECSLNRSMRPECYHSRSRPILNVALLYYGDYWSMDDLDRLEPILTQRFKKASSASIELNIVIKQVIDFKYRAPDDYENNNIKDRDRLQRLWYYDNVGAKVMTEIYNVFKAQHSEELIDQLDAVLAVTGAQFNGMGFANGRISITEQPQEIAWGLEDGGRVEVASDYRIVDELIHELGHNMFLGHTSTDCFKKRNNYKEMQACCKKSPNKNDVLSYCRNRKKVSEDFMHGFESCNQKMIDNLVVPAILSGGDWKVKNRTKCL